MKAKYLFLATAAVISTIACGRSQNMPDAPASPPAAPTAATATTPAPTAPAPPQPASSELLELQSAHAAPAANGALPPGHPPITGQPPMELKPIDATLGKGEAGLAWNAPADWVAVPPSSSMRRAQYRVPGKAGDAECAVFYFGPGQGGDAQSNAERWASQFLGADGQPTTAKTRDLATASGKVLIVETAGAYQSGSMTGTAVESKPGYALLGAIAQGPDANWFFKLTGPKATVDAQRGAFETMVSSIRRGN